MFLYQFHFIVLQKVLTNLQLLFLTWGWPPPFLNMLNKTCNIEAEEDWWGWWFWFFEIFKSVLLALTPDCNVENGVFLQSAIFPLPQNFASFVWTDVTICLQNGPSTNGIKNRNFKPIHTSMILHIHEGCSVKWVWPYFYRICMWYMHMICI